MSKKIKHHFSKFQPTRNFLIGFGQKAHLLTSRLTIWSAGYKVRSIPPLDSDKALANGSEFLGESFIFLVSGVILVWEYDRGKEKERQKEEKIILDIRNESNALNERLNKFDEKINDIEKLLGQFIEKAAAGKTGIQHVDHGDGDKTGVAPIDSASKKHSWWIWPYF